MHLLLVWTSSGIWWWKLHSYFHYRVGGENPRVLCHLMTRKSTDGENQDVAQPLQTCFGAFRKVTSPLHPSTTKSCNIYHLHLGFTRFGPPNYIEHSSLKPSRAPWYMGSWWIHLPPTNQPWPHEKPGQLTIPSLTVGWDGCLNKNVRAGQE